MIRRAPALLEEMVLSINVLLLLQPQDLDALFPRIGHRRSMEAAIEALRRQRERPALAAPAATAVKPMQMQVDSTEGTEAEELHTSLVETARRTLRQKLYEALLRPATRTSDRAAKLAAALAAALVSLDTSDTAVLMADIVRASLEKDIDQRAVRLTDVLVRCRAATQALPRGDLTEDLEPHLAAAQAAISNFAV